MAVTDEVFRGTIINTVTVTAPAGIIDPDESNNSATDSSLTDGLFADSFETPLQVIKRWLETFFSNEG